MFVRSGQQYLHSRMDVFIESFAAATLHEVAFQIESCSYLDSEYLHLIYTCETTVLYHTHITTKRNSLHPNNTLKHHFFSSPNQKKIF